MKRIKPISTIEISNSDISEGSEDKVPSQLAVKEFSVPKIIMSREPLTSDNTYLVPSVWLSTTSDNIYVLVDITNNIANWKLLTVPSSLIFKGSINVNTDFPLIADVEEGWLLFMIIHQLEEQHFGLVDL